MVGHEGLALDPSVVAVEGVVAAVAMVGDWAVWDLVAASAGAVGVARVVEAEDGVVVVEQEVAFRGWAVEVGREVAGAAGSGLEVGKEVVVVEVTEAAMAAAMVVSVVKAAVEAWAAVAEARHTSDNWHRPDSVRH